jgi:hypothetical protein
MPDGLYSYLDLVECLNRFIDEVGTDKQHQLSTLLDTLGTPLSTCEKQKQPQQWETSHRTPGAGDVLSTAYSPA